ncbi:hypothetical protein JCM16358_25690 [Halanaerocella petrolearia]
MKFAAKLARKVKKILSTDSKNEIIEGIVTRIIAEMKAKKKRGKNEIYVPDYYRIQLSSSELELINRQLKIEIKEIIKEKLEEMNFKLRNDLQLNFSLKHNLEQPAIKGEFKLNTETITQETKLFQKESNKEDISMSATSTIKIKPVARRKAYLELLMPEKEERSFLLNSVETNIGRQPNNEIVISDPSVSRVHAQIINKKYYYLIRDLNSTNGVLVNGELVTEKQLCNGDKIKLGEAVLNFYYEK